MINSKELCQKLRISERTLATWRSKIIQISGHKFKMEANPRGYSHYLYSEKDFELFQKLSKKIGKSGDIDSSVRQVFGDRYEVMIEERIEFLDYDIEKLQAQVKSLEQSYKQFFEQCNKERELLEERILQLEEAFETEQGKGALERLGFRKAKSTSQN